MTRVSGLCRASVLALLGAVGLAGCDDELAAYGSAEPSEEQLAAAELALAAAQSQARVDEGPDEPHDDSIDACVERLSRETPASVQETIDVVGYTGLLRDTCRARIAEEGRDPAPCEQIEARLVRSACLVRVAIAARSPALCPTDARGRNPLCVALASQRLALCQAAPHLEREACHALLGDTAHGCQTSIAPELCEGVVRRHQRRLDERTPLAVVPPASRVEPPELVVTLTRRLSGQPDEPIGDETVLDAFDRGARIVEDHGRLVLELADPLGLSAVSHVARASIAIRVPLPPAVEGADDERLDVLVAPLGASVEAFHPELGALRASDGEVHFTHLSRELGGTVEGRFTVSCPSAPGAIRIQGRFRTFLRDVGPAEPVSGDPLEGLEQTPE